MTREELKEALKYFEKNVSPNSDYLSEIRNEIFKSYEKGDIMETQKNKLLKELYRIASEKKMFYVTIMDRKPENLPQEEEEEEEYDSSYEESYEESYDEEEEEDAD